MRRWNGWGDDGTHYPLPASAASYLERRVGSFTPPPDATLAQAAASAPPSRIENEPTLRTDALDRLLHARGQSLPDWVALRSGCIGAFPDAVAYPNNESDVRALLGAAARRGWRLIPYGGGTSVVGHINPLPGAQPVVTVDLSRLSRLLDLDETSRLATFEAGVAGPALEAALNARGYTLGHFPQSFELSTLGGWIASRSCGQQSYYYGRIEDLFAGGHVETPAGALDLDPHPASAAGPDLRQALLGSEGRLGVITRAVVRVREAPECEAFYGVFFRDWESGAAAVRELAQQRAPLSLLRLSDAQETETTLALSGKDSLVAWANRGLGLLRYGPERCLLVFGVTGSRRLAAYARRLALDVARSHGGLFTGSAIGRMWRKSRFLTPYLRNTLWECGYALDTLETALPWASVLAAAGEIKHALRHALEPAGETALVFSHLSHVYRDGASTYVTYLFRRAATPDETLQRWHALKQAASRVIVAHRAPVSHQHGVGLDHAPYLPAEKGAVGMALLESLSRTADPGGILNPGKLLAPPAFTASDQS